MSNLLPGKFIFKSEKHSIFVQFPFYSRFSDKNEVKMFRDKK